VVAVLISDFDQIGDECNVYGKGPNAGDGDVNLSAVGQDIVIPVIGAEVSCYPFCFVFDVLNAH